MKIKREPTIEYLKDLNEDIWEQIHYSHSATEQKPRRRLYHTEWETILEAAQTHKLACVISNDNFGFSFCVSFFESPLAPGSPVDKAILVVTWQHVPKSIAELKAYDSVFSTYWKFFVDAFKTPRNEELLELYGLPEVKHSSYYKY